MEPIRYLALAAAATAAALLLGACGGSDDDAGLPQLGAATGATLTSCADLRTRYSFANTTIAAASAVSAGTLTVAGTPVGAHCQVTGSMFSRTSAVDGKAYAIGFEMRLPNAWNGRFFYQANGGTDGAVGTASGGIGGGGPLTNALQQGYAVISSDAGHNAAQNPSFGIDPQARLDYGYQAVGKLTPMAKGLIAAAYGKAPDRSYLGGCSNGGRHALVAASRYGDLYDGIVAGDPGFNLPQSAVAQMYGAQQYATVSTATVTPGGLPDINTSFTQAELNVVAAGVLARCDALDGATDGLVNDTKACRGAFSILTDVPTCSGARDGSCVTAAQKSVLQKVFSGARDSTGKALYTSFPWDAGINGANWRAWKFGFSVNLARDPGATAYIFQTPPVAATDGLAFALGFNIDTEAPKIYATNATYTEASMTFMTPPHPSDLSVLKNRGAKLVIYHGTSDPVFSSDDTARYVDALRAANGGDASDFARYFEVPGMNHCSGGPATDQFNMLDALVNWVEKGQAPDSVVATARGAGNAGGVNTELPSSWAANRTRPLCPYPKVARYNGSGSLDAAGSFTCR